MLERYEENIKTLLAEFPFFFVGTLWTILSIMTNQSFIGLIGLAILYRRYSKKVK